jgi:hypothetical protein
VPVIVAEVDSKTVRTSAPICVGRQDSISVRFDLGQPFDAFIERFLDLDGKREIPLDRQLRQNNLHAHDRLARRSASEVTRPDAMSSSPRRIFSGSRPGIVICVPSNRKIRPSSSIVTSSEDSPTIRMLGSSPPE